VALSFAVLIILFTILFGSRRSRPRQTRFSDRGAFESLVKLIALACIGLYAVYGCWQLRRTGDWLRQNHDAAGPCAFMKAVAPYC
jgi:hypothetical protein